VVFGLFSAACNKTSNRRTHHEMFFFVYFIASAYAFSCVHVCEGDGEQTNAIQALLLNISCSSVELFGTCNVLPLSIVGGGISGRELLIRGTLRAARKWSATTMLSVSGVQEFRLGGGGRIDGNGHLWWTGNNTQPGRPILVEMDGRGVIVEDLELRNAAFYHLYITGSHYRLRNISIESPDYLTAPNTDGIDIGAEFVHVQNCRVKNGDDSICIKAGANHVLVEDSQVEQGNGLVIGTGNLQSSNITFRNCSTYNTLYGINLKFKHNQTGFLNGVLFDSIKIR